MTSGSALPPGPAPVPAARVLVVDDEPRNRTTLTRFLERAGYAVSAAGDGRVALELVDREHFDLVLLDVLMPGLNGLEVLRRLRAHHPRDRLPVIMTTSLTDSSAVVEALELGANDYVGKPFDFPKLVARVGAEVSARVPAPGRPTVGALVANRYLLRGVLGTGSFGAVYRAEDLERDERPVAIKLVHPDRGIDAQTLASFHQEARALSRLNHPGLTDVLAFGVTDTGAPYLVCELLVGTNLADLLERETRLDPGFAVAVAGPVAGALAHAHGVGVVHRDLKPVHVMLVETEVGLQPKLIDFGIASLRGRPVAGEELGLVGTPAYMAPELFRGQRADDRTDVYALGAILFEMLVGEAPFDSSSDDPEQLAWLHVEAAPPQPSTRVAGLSPSLEALVLCCLAKQPADRPPASEVARRLADELAISSEPAAGGVA